MSEKGVSMSKYKPGDEVIVSELCSRLKAGTKVKIEALYPPTILRPEGEVLYGVNYDSPKPIRVSDTFIWESEIAGLSPA